MSANKRRNRQPSVNQKISDYERLAASMRYFEAIDPHYLSALDNYILTAGKWIESERAQGVARLKAYQDIFTRSVATGVVPDWSGLNTNKFRILRPIMKLLDKALRDRNYAAIQLLATVLRVRNLITLNNRELTNHFKSWLECYTIEVSTPEMRKSKPLTLQEVKQKDPECREYYLKTDKNHYIRFNQLLAPPRAVDYRRDLRRLCPNFNIVSYEGFLRSIHPTLNNLVSLSRVEPQQLAMLALKSSSTTIYDQRSGHYRSLPSMVAAEYDGAILHSPHFLELLEFIQELGQVGADVMSTTSQRFTIRDSMPSLTPEEKGHLVEEVNFGPARSFVIGNPRDKARVVTTGCYSLQYAQSILHDSLRRLLSRIPYDYADSHERGFDALREATNVKSFVACYDLHSATDEFPAALMAINLEYLYGSKYAELWYRASRLPIIVLSPDRSSDRLVQFTKGSQMGWLGNWDVFSISHHLILGYAYYLTYNQGNWLRQSDRLLYGLVGDDNFITRPAIASRYVSLMSELSVPVNTDKSQILDSQRGLVLTEFCKRQCVPGSEVSGINPVTLVNATRSYAGVYELASLCQDRHLALQPKLESVTFEKVVRYLRRKNRHCSVVPLYEFRLGLQIPPELGGLNPEFSRSPYNGDESLSFAQLAALCYYNAKTLGKMHSSGRVYSTKGQHSREIVDSKVQSSFDALPDEVDVADSVFANYQRRISMHNTITDLDSWSAIQAAINRFVEDVVALASTDLSPCELLELRSEVVTSFCRVQKTFKEKGVIPFYDLRAAVASSAETAMKRYRRLMTKHPSPDVLTLYGNTISVAPVGPLAAKAGQSDYEALFACFGETDESPPVQEPLERSREPLPVLPDELLPKLPSLLRQQVLDVSNYEECLTARKTALEAYSRT